MKNKKQPYGLIIRELIEEKRLKIVEIADSLNMSRNNVYQIFGRESMKLSELDKWALALGVTTQEIIDRAEGKQTDLEKTQEKSDNNYLMEKLAKLEVMFSELNKSLQEKDKQITKLIDLLGKPEGVSDALLSKESLFFRPNYGKYGYTPAI